jgi:hypothetical protein
VSTHPGRSGKARTRRTYTLTSRSKPCDLPLHRRAQRPVAGPLAVPGAGGFARRLLRPAAAAPQRPGAAAGTPAARVQTPRQRLGGSSLSYNNVRDMEACGALLSAHAQRNYVLARMQATWRLVPCQPGRRN